MFNFLNMQTKAQFLEECMTEGRTLTKSPTNPYEWIIRDSEGSVWVVGWESTSQFYILKHTSVEDKTPVYMLHVIVAGQRVKIICCRTEGKTYMADKYLKKYTNIAGLVGNYLYYGYLK